MLQLIGLGATNVKHVEILCDIDKTGERFNLKGVVWLLNCLPYSVLTIVVAEGVDDEFTIILILCNWF